MCLCNPDIRTPFCKNCPLPSGTHVTIKPTYESVWEKHGNVKLHKCIETEGGELWFDILGQVLEIGDDTGSSSCLSFYSKTVLSPEHLDKVLSVLLD